MENLDIIIVNWNSGRQLLDCLESISAAYGNNEYHLSACIVVDNGSVDTSMKDIENATLPIVKIINTDNKGFAFACNQGAAHGHSDYVLFLNPDVRLQPDSLEKAMRCIKKPERTSTGILGIQLVDNSGKVQLNVARFPNPLSIISEMLGMDRLCPRYFPSMIMADWNHLKNREVDHVQGAFYLVRRNIFVELQGFDERFFLYYEDLDFSLRAKQAGWTSYYLADAKAYHHGGGTTKRIMARKLYYHWCSLTQYMAKHYGVMAGLVILLFIVGLEIWARMIWHIIHLSGRETIQTVQAYAIFIWHMPSLVKKIVQAKGIRQPSIENLRREKETQNSRPSNRPHGWE